MKTALMGILMALLAAVQVQADQSTITEADGSACLGDDRSKKQTEQAAMTDAKKRAVEFASTYIKSETEVKNFMAEKDLLAAYAQAEVKVLQELDKVWYKDPSFGDCYKVRIRAEVVPDAKAIERMAAANPTVMDDPSAPLKVKVWTDQKAYKDKEKIKIYIKGNKPFYARVLYKDAGGETIQILPNPYRSENYFNGGVVYEIPSGNDRFDLTVNPPFGDENIIVYASAAPLGEISLVTRGAMFEVRSQDVDVRTRGVKLGAKGDAKKGSGPAAEFFEDKVVVRTGGK